MFNHFFNRFKKAKPLEPIKEEPVIQEFVIEKQSEEPENPYLVKTKKTGYKNVFINISMNGHHETTYHGAYEYTEERLLPIRQDSTNSIPEEPEEPHLPDI